MVMMMKCRSLDSICVLENFTARVLITLMCLQLSDDVRMCHKQKELFFRDLNLTSNETATNLASEGGRRSWCWLIARLVDDDAT